MSMMNEVKNWIYVLPNAGCVSVDDSEKRRRRSLSHENAQMNNPSSTDKSLTTDHHSL